MKNKKLIMFIGVVILIIIVLVIGYMVHINIKNNKKGEITEYIPQEEITDEQLRKTIVTLYFMEAETGKLVPEPRKVDVKELINDPYYFLVSLLIGGPKSESMVGIFPEATILNEANLIGNMVHLDFSEEFIEGQYLGEEQEKLIIKSIINTLTELTEVEGIVITINGQENMGFPDNRSNV